MSEEVRGKVAEEVRKGNLVIIHPQASQKFSGSKVRAIDYPRGG